MKRMWQSASYMCSNSASNSETLNNIAQYIEDYIDLVENIPNDVARQISRLYEYNNRYYQLIDKLQTVLEILQSQDFSLDPSPLAPQTTSSPCPLPTEVYTDLPEIKTSETIEKKRAVRALYTLQRCLLEMQEISDEKLYLSQTIMDQLDYKARQLDYDHRIVTSLSSLTSKHVQHHNNDTSSIVGVNSSSSIGTNSKDLNKGDSSSVSSGNNGTNGICASGNGHLSSIGGKRASSRRGNSRNFGDDGNGSCGNGNGGKRGVKRGVKSNAKDVKRSKTGKDNMHHSPMLLFEETPIDPDEPTYCSCEQISYGEMICCDNPACAIEWFHFACVSLTTKPKGKWYCPNCRGDRSNTPKK